jgi:signal transduction histidine kinase
MPAIKQRSPFAQFDALSRIMNIGVLLLDSAAELQFANALACELLGYINEEDLKGGWRRMKALLLLDADLPETTRPRPLKVDLPVKDQVRFLRLEIYALEEGFFRGYLILLKDRQSVDVLETQLLLARQMQSQAHLYGVLIHDLRAPLNVMQITLELFADILADGAADDNQSRPQRYLTVLREELARLNRTLHTVLDQGARLSSASQEFDLRAIIEEVAAQLGPQASLQCVDLRIRLPVREVKILGHRDRLKLALFNVAINRLEAMPNGGRLQIDMMLQDSTVNIAVKDDGPSIPDELLDEIYHVYLTTDKSGSAMGLYVVRLVLESHGGDIEVHSQPGEGVSFTLTLPLAGAADV